MKSKLTPELQKEIGNYILLGSPLKFAAEASGISEKAFYNWMSQGEKESKGKFREFYDYINECKAKSVQLHLKLITSAAKEGNWTASAWILERRFSNEFGKRDKLELDANMKHSGEIDINSMSDEDLQRAIDYELNRILKERDRQSPEASE